MKKRKKRFLAMLLAAVMVFSLLPVSAFAIDSVSNGIIVSNKKYNISPGVVEYELITNDSSLSKQQAGHVMEVSLGADTEIITGYNDYNIEAIKSGTNWGMKETTLQAQAIETRRGVNVVGAVNASFFNMANGQPIGALVMNGTVIATSGAESTFWIDSEGAAHISGSDFRVTEEMGVKEAVGGSSILVKNGEVVYPASSSDGTNPRTAVGIKADGTVVFYEVDGRQAPYSTGMTLYDLAFMMKDLGCVDAMNLDGGGSSTFATQREGEDNDNGTAGLTLRNRPSDGYERTVSSTIMVISNATQTGEFDHAVLSPDSEIYTPGSTVQFSASGVDAAGGAASLPESGLSWSVQSGSELGSIDAATGEFTAAEGKTGTVTVALSCNGAVVGTAELELQWPDRLDFTNTSVSLDFGETSDLTFNPTYNGRAVNYKDGDFVWSIVDNDELSYKYNTIVETKAANEETGYAGNGVKDFTMALNGKLGVEQKLQYSAYGTWWNRSTAYMEVSRQLSMGEDGAFNVTSVVKNTRYWTYEYIRDDSSTIVGQNEIEHTDGLQADQSFTFSIGSIRDNRFAADDGNSLRAEVSVALANNSEVTGSVNIIVGMEPYVLMDFEDYTDPATGVISSAEDYWKIHVGASSGSGGNGQLTIDEMRDSLVWIRDTTNKGVIWPKNADGSEVNGIVSSAEDSSVRFGSNAMRLAWDFTKIDSTVVAVADFGFSSAVYVNAVQPTKLGMWVNIPKEHADDNSVIKAILVGGAYPTDSESLAYRQLEDDGSMTFVAGKNLSGTTTYFQYYSYDENGERSGSTLADWAGKGWIWIEADISSLQFPINVQRGYSVRITSPQNCTKGSGYILIDNLQLIYGTNTNDTLNPVIDSVTERTTNQAMTSESVEFTSASLNFEAVYNDRVTSGGQAKYNTGIDLNGVKVYIDGVDMTASAEVNSGSLYLAAEGLKNGPHTLKIQVKDNYGNVTTGSYPFTVNDENGESSAVSIVPADEAASPEIGKDYTLNIVNNSTSMISSVKVSLEIQSGYAEAWNVSFSEAYEGTAVYDKDTGCIVISAGAREDAELTDVIASVSFSIPEDAAKGDQLKYAIASGVYTDENETASFAESEKAIDITAAYNLENTPVTAGFPCTFTVTDNEGNAVEGISVYSGDTVLGVTDENGLLSYTYGAGDSGRKTVYARNETGRSWNDSFVVNVVSAENDGEPYGIQNNAVNNADTCQSITWLSAIGDVAEADSIVRLSTDKDMAEAAEVKGSNEFRTFTQTDSGIALRINKVLLTDLSPSTTYYYQVGDGEKWSETLSFTTDSGDSKAATNFFVFADIQSNDTANLNAAIQNVTGGELAYSFGIQTGDAIDNVHNYTTYWRPYLTEMNGSALDGINMIHVMGNHEYYGDISGEVCGDIFDLPESEQGSFYSFEYGNVYVGVINNGGSIADAVEEMKADAANSDCAWKVVVLHEPIYGTESTMADETRAIVTKAMEDAGIDAVFSGDDHAYARTFPMIGDEVSEDESKGVVYYISGDLSSKDNEYHTQDYFAKAMPHSEYVGMYLSVQADADSMVINAYKYDGTLLDSYTIEKTDCEKGKHSFSADSEYNTENQTLTCTVCGEECSAEETGMSGMFKVKGSAGDNVVLAEGRVKTGWFQWGEETVHAGDDGVLHKTVSGNTATCTENGHYYAKCETCGASYTGAATWSTGHDWDENHVCKTCGTEGIDINNVQASYGKYYTYTGGKIYPSVKLTYEGRTLSTSSSRTGKDAYRSYSNNVEVGIGNVIFEGRGDFYGTLTLEFQILPASVSGFKSEQLSANSYKLSWDEAAGAQEYILQKYNPGTEKWSVVKITDETEYTVTGLETGSCSFRVYCRAQGADGKQYYCAKYSSTIELVVKPIAAENISCTVFDGRTVMLTETDDGSFLLLPAGTDMSKLLINADSIGGELSIVGDLGSAKPGSSFDIAKVASAVDGAYSVTLTDGQLSQQITIRRASVASMFITSDDAVNNGREYVDASKDNSATGRMLLVGTDGSVIYDGSLSQLKARGNSSFTYAPKKSYQIKLDPKDDLLGNGENVKTWVLLANYNDPTMLHDKLFKDLAADLGMYSADCDWVDLYYDGEYRGTYLLSEKNSVSKTCVDITELESEYEKVNEGYGNNAEIKTDKNAYGQTYFYTKGLTDPENITGGYLLEINGSDRGVDEASGFSTSKGYDINVKSPEWASQAAMKYISEYYQEFEDAVYATDSDGNYTGYNETTGKYYYDYCDLDSLVKMYLIQELSASTDAFYASLFFYKDADGKLCAGPVWDMDLSLGSAWDMKVSANNSFVDRRYLAEALINIPGFQEAVKEYFNSQFKKTVESYINTGIGAYADTLSDSAAMNFTIWPYVNIADPSSSNHVYSDMDYATAVSNCKAWVAERLTYMQTRISSWGTEESVFPDVSTDSVYYSSIVWAVDNGIINGYQDGSFKPDVSANRGQVVTMLWRAAGCPEPATGTNPFSDVSDTGSCAPYYKAILWANENGIALGYEDGCFRPYQACTRAQVVTFLWRFAEEPESTAENIFSDVSDTGSCAPYYNAILWANENGIALGYEDGCFRPYQICSRAQIVTFIARYLQGE